MIIKGHLETLVFLYEHRDHPALRQTTLNLGERVESCFGHVTAQGYTYVGRFLMESGILPDKQGLLPKAAALGDLELVERFWDLGYTQELTMAFTEATRYHRYDVASFLLDKGPDISYMSWIALIKSVACSIWELPRIATNHSESRPRTAVWRLFNCWFLIRE